MSHPTPDAGVQLTPQTLRRAAHDVADLVGSLERLNSGQLTPTNQAVVSHIGLARALSDCRPRWRRALAVITADCRHISELLHTHSVATHQADQSATDYFTRAAVPGNEPGTNSNHAAHGGVDSRGRWT